MVLTKEEAKVVQDAFTIFTNFLSQTQPQAVDGVVRVLKSVIGKIEVAVIPATGEIKKPDGITDEQFEKVCKAGCTSYIEGSCKDPITAKFPGKCDTILKSLRPQTKKAE